MKQKFSTSWLSSKQPRKQRKYLYNLTNHLKRKVMASGLSKELKVRFGVNAIEVRTNDIVRIMRGKFKKKEGKVVEINMKKKNNLEKQLGSQIYEVLDIQFLSESTFILFFPKCRFEFLPGQHVNISIMGEQIGREYSIYSSPNDDFLKTTLQKAIQKVVDINPEKSTDLTFSLILSLDFTRRVFGGILGIVSGSFNIMYANLSKPLNIHGFDKLTL